MRDIIQPPADANGEVIGDTPWKLLQPPKSETDVIRKALILTMESVIALMRMAEARRDPKEILHGT